MKKRNFTTVLLLIIMGVGLSLLLYPSIANYWNSFHASQVMTDYVETVSELKDNEVEKLWAEAVEYNKEISKRGGACRLSDAELEKYDNILNIGGNGVMGIIDIDSVGISLPIYHGTSEGVLQIAVGHVEWSSLPVGGESSHCVLSGHRGLPSAKLFTDLDLLREGDTFTVTVLDQVLTYEIDQIRIVLPDELENLKIENGKDFCTLVTCTPYGINTHRLLIRGHRIETINKHHIVSEAVTISPMIVAPVVAALPIIILLCLVFMKPKRKTTELDEELYRLLEETEDN